MACCWCRMSTILSAGVRMGIAVGERASSIFVAKILNCSSLKCWLPLDAPRILIHSDLHGSFRPIGVCIVAQLRCNGVGLSIKIKDSAGFKR